MNTNPRFRRLLAGSVLAAGGCWLAALPTLAVAQASDFPNRPIELVVPFGAGGGTDVLARVFAEAAKKHISQPLTVINKPGASGAIGLAEVAQSRPDGYKMAMMTIEMAILPHMGSAKFVADDFTPIVRLNQDPIVLTVRAEAPWNSIEDFVEAVKNSKEPMKFGNAGPGGLSHLAAVAMQQRLNSSFTHVPFQGNAPAVLALIGGHIDAVTSTPSEVSTYVATGKLKTLAVFADQRIKGGFEQVPTLKERKIDLSMRTWRGIGVPKGTPADIVSKLTAACVATANEPAVKEAMEKQNLGYAVADGETFKRDITRDSALFKTLTEQLGVKN